VGVDDSSEKGNLYKVEGEISKKLSLSGDPKLQYQNLSCLPK